LNVYNYEVKDKAFVGAIKKQTRTASDEISKTILVVVCFASGQRFV
jgi:hypothetical protein